MTLAERLAAALVAAPAGVLLPGDHPDIVDDAGLIEAAVLVPITDRAHPGVILTQRTETLRAAWVPEGASGQVERVAARFALVAVAGELATSASLTGWPEGEAERAVFVERLGGA